MGTAIESSFFGRAHLHSMGNVSILSIAMPYPLALSGKTPYPRVLPTCSGGQGISQPTSVSSNVPSAGNTKALFGIYLILLGMGTAPYPRVPPKCPPRPEERAVPSQRASLRTSHRTEKQKHYHICTSYPWVWAWRSTQECRPHGPPGRKTKPQQTII